MSTQESSSPSDDAPAVSGSDDDRPQRSQPAADPWAPMSAGQGAEAEGHSADGGQQSPEGEEHGAEGGAGSAGDPEGAPDPTGASTAHDPPPAPEPGRLPRDIPGPHAQFADKQRPQRYATASARHHPTTPLDPIKPYMAGPVPRRRKSDWPVLLFAMIVAAIVMAGCCIAGFGIFRSYGLG